MLNVAKATPSMISAQTTFLNKIVGPSSTSVRAFSSVAFNVKSKFEKAFKLKQEQAAAKPKKQ